MKKENIQSRNRKLSAKARKKHSTFPMNHHHPGVNPATSIDMLKPLEKMYGYGAMGMAAAAGMPGMSGMGGMGSMTAASAVSPYASYASLGHAQQSAAAGVSMSMAAAHAAQRGRAPRDRFRLPALCARAVLVRALRAERRIDCSSVASCTRAGGLQEALRRFTSGARRELEAALQRTMASGRGVQQLVRVAETLSDLEHSDSVRLAHVEESVLLSLPSAPEASFHSPPAQQCAVPPNRRIS